MALPNLTRDQAVERAALVTVDNYRIALDLTDGDGKPGERTFRSVTTVEFDALAGADTYIDIAADSSAARPSTGAISTSPDTTNPPASADRAGRAQRRSSSTPTAATPTPARACTASSIPSTARSTCTRSSKPPTRSGCSPASTSPTSRPPSTSWWPHRRTGSHLQRRHGHVRRRGGCACAHLRHHTANEHLPCRADRRAVLPMDDTYSDEHGDIPLGLYCRKSLAEFMDPERLFTQTKQGFGFYHRNFGTPTHSASTTSSSFPSSTRERWRTPEPSRSWRTTSSAAR